MRSSADHDVAGLDVGDVGVGADFTPSCLSCFGRFVLEVSG